MWGKFLGTDSNKSIDGANIVVCCDSSAKQIIEKYTRLGGRFFRVDGIGVNVNNEKCKQNCRNMGLILNKLHNPVHEQLMQQTDLAQV